MNGRFRAQGLFVAPIMYTKIVFFLNIVLPISFKNWLTDSTVEEKDNSLKLVANGRLFNGLTPTKPFPITYPNFIIFKDVHGVDVCVIKNYENLSSESRKSLQTLLDKIYFIPRILSIERIDTSGNEFEWETLTDKEPRTIRTRGRMSVIPMSNRIIVTDINDNVYEIENLAKLDAKSRSEIEATL